jgi:ABC-type phosphate transport system substrate-binding protein
VENVRGKSHPCSREEAYHTYGEPTGMVKKFVDFTVSEAGQKIAAEVGFIPLMWSKKKTGRCFFESSWVRSGI